MTDVQKTEAIKDKLEADLPALLSAAGLDDFDEYNNKSPLRSDDNEICVYINGGQNDVVSNNFAVIVQIQLSGKDLIDEYHSIVKDYMLENITADIVDMVERVNFIYDIWPYDVHSNNTFAYYEITFEDKLDDCDI